MHKIIVLQVLTEYGNSFTIICIGQMEVLELLHTGEPSVLKIPVAYAYLLFSGIDLEAALYIEPEYIFVLLC